uniref:Uncharacterized protein n=1 Tax=Sphaerodactylus townsendi TaxID=933632 RepID=A0ACB8EMV5_9SAUR
MVWVSVCGVGGITTVPAPKCHLPKQDWLKVPTTSCTKFYHPSKGKPEHLNTIYHGDVCPIIRRKLFLAQQKKMNKFIIKEAGTDINPQAKHRKFISHMKCRQSLKLQINADYLVSGHSKDLWPTKNDVNYIISKDTWIEKWPSEDECQEEEFQNLCNDFLEFSNRITLFGCDN